MNGKVEDFTVGTKIFVELSRGQKLITEIVRTTKTLFMGEKDHWRFSKSNSKMVGAGEWIFNYAHPYTEENLAEYKEYRDKSRRKYLAKKIALLGLDLLTVDELFDILEKINKINDLVE